MAEGGLIRSGVTVGLGLEEQLSKFPAHLLDRPCTESHLGKLVHCITTDAMVLMAADLGLTAVEIDDVRTAWQAWSPLSCPETENVQNVARKVPITSNV